MKQITVPEILKNMYCLNFDISMYNASIGKTISDAIKYLYSLSCQILFASEMDIISTSESIRICDSLSDALAKNEKSRIYIGEK